MKSRNLLASLGLAAALLLAFVPSARAGSITCPPTLHLLLSPGSSWEYTFSDPSGNPDWQTFGGVDTVTWFTGQAPFGNFFGDADFSPNTYWPESTTRGDDLWVRTHLDLTGLNLDAIIWELGVDNGFTLYFNGALQGAANAEGFASRWEYNGDLFGATPGLNAIALALEDHGGLTAFDMQVTGVEFCHPMTPVPEPSTYGLGAAAVLAVGVWLRRRKAA